MRNYLFFTALFLMLCASAIAAEVSPTVTTENGNRVYFWEEVNTADTAGEGQIEGGSYLVNVRGTQATADFEIRLDPAGTSAGQTMQKVDSNLVSAGGQRFTSATTLEYQPCVTLPDNGFVDFVFNSAGSSTQDLDFRLVKMSYGCR